ncbi:MAG: glycosyltransferase 87 family protein [Chloroflexota bacterium]
MKPDRREAAVANFKWILLLWIGARLMLLMAWPAENLTLYGDYRYYFDLAALSDAGQLPFLDYWSEHAPLFPFINLLTYHLGGGLFKNHVLLNALVLLAFEAGALILLYRMAVEVHGERRAEQIGWAYAALYIPVVIWLGTFEAMTAFFVLLALLALRRDRLWLTGLAIGLGALTKYVPLVLLVIVWRRCGWRAALRAGLIALLICAAVLGPLLALSPEFTLASLRSQAAKSSWQTVWALIDGNLGHTGNLGPLADRFDPARASQSLHHPSRLPGWLTLLPFALLGLFALSRPVVRPGDDDLIFAALAVILLFLWAKGWSPQWQMFLLPLLLLALPLTRALAFVLVLGFVNLLEWPVILSRGLTGLLPLTTLLRTLILALLAWELYRQMRQPGEGADTPPR